MRLQRFSRRTIMGCTALLAGLTNVRSTRAENSLPTFAYPLAWPDRVAGDGFFIRHGYACENTWYLPGYWHTGEDWYAINEAETAGANVVSCSEGEVVFAGSEYPGLVVIVQHDDELYSMYGHLNYNLSVAIGDAVETGQILGTVLNRSDKVPSHLHFESRTFLTTPEVNGDAPRYGFNCGYECAPGPGYWPIDDGQHPSEMGWLNPTHVIANRAELAEQHDLVVQSDRGVTITIWSSPDLESVQVGELVVEAGESVEVMQIVSGPEATTGTSAEAYEIWGELEDGSGWISLIAASAFETGSDGRPSTVELALVFDPLSQ